ncbi:SDR family oxidoreductase [Terricaulis silvestris]|uniref:D-xylose 1-dehydrogenase n=1 Tax=Terricaulis silvestris TaxID=2686094 RepID=A0A6I6MZY2_9CAUL|nr:SDR family oxidoreductase [Terricaulis silvestris]QGZ96673.1 2,5-dichloro-2,5-cyclohexadiene-1,4-diol dehydrogenase [Terricaulis silvestris]
MKVLANKVAIITGASSGIGHAAAKLFAAEGARLVLVARRQAELEALASEIGAHGGECAILAGDVRHEETALDAVTLAQRAFGGLDIAFNNAGSLGEMGEVTEISPDGWRDAIEVNLTSAFFAARHQIPAMLARGRGSLIYTSTFVGHTAGFPGMSAYAASKAGVIGLTRNLAAEYGRKGIRVNALLPGAVDTPMGRSVAHSEEIRSFVANLNAMKRIAAPEELARAALFLASDASSFMTGEAMLVDGGVSINRT